jgi:hypothetical protein
MPGGDHAPTPLVDAVQAKPLEVSAPVPGTRPGGDPGSTTSSFSGSTKRIRLFLPHDRASPATCSASCSAASAPRSAAPARPLRATPGWAPSHSCTASAPPLTPTSTSSSSTASSPRATTEPSPSSRRRISADDVQRLERTLQRRVLRLFQRARRKEGKAWRWRPGQAAGCGTLSRRTRSAETEVSTWTVHDRSIPRNEPPRSACCQRPFRACSAAG